MKGANLYPTGAEVTSVPSDPPQLMYQSGYASYDSLTGYYDFLFRSYDPALGRFFAFDPMAASTPSYSPYHANFNNPISFTDPLGLSPRDGRFKDFGGTFNGDDSGFDAAMSDMNRFMNSMDDGDYGSLTPKWQRNELGSNMLTNAWNNAPTGGSATTYFSDGFPTRKVVFSAKYHQKRYKKASLKRRDYWTLGEQLTNYDGEFDGGLEPVNYATKDVFDWDGYLADYVGASDFGEVAEPNRDFQYLKLGIGVSANLSFFSGSFAGSAAFSGNSVGFNFNSGGGLKNSKATSAGFKLKFSLGLVYGDEELRNVNKTWQAFSTLAREFGIAGNGVYTEVKSTNSSSTYNYGASLTRRRMYTKNIH
ncbi:RHS repeat-associated core domain-containing protein [Ekhidna sp. To15]|uniref:RHS repeat-associated core domain-containing protein n=1 Tax=Ekhidna sp. To15 TaxID=3395267 RepID=UPI003F525BF6